MSAIIVQRGLGDRQGPDITADLLTSDLLRVNRGRAEIDKNCSPRVRVSIRGTWLGWIPPGSLVQVSDAERGLYRGVVVECVERFTRTSLTEFTADTDLVIEREEV